MSCNTTGVSELEFDGISIFPNPAADKLYISNMRERFNYEVFNVTGQMILSGDFKFDNDFIDLKNIANGFYVIRIKCGERFINRRFVKG